MPFQQLSGIEQYLGHGPFIHAIIHGTVNFNLVKVYLFADSIHLFSGPFTQNGFLILDAGQSAAQFELQLLYSTFYDLSELNHKELVTRLQAFYRKCIVNIFFSTPKHAYDFT